MSYKVKMSFQKILLVLFVLSFQHLFADSISVKIDNYLQQCYENKQFNGNVDTLLTTSTLWGIHTNADTQNSPADLGSNCGICVKSMKICRKFAEDTCKKNRYSAKRNFSSNGSNSQKSKMAANVYIVKN